MKVLLIALHFARSNANTFRYRRLAEALSREGSQVDVVGDRPLSGYELPGGVSYASLWREVSVKSVLPIIWWTAVCFFRSWRVWRMLSNKYLAYQILIAGAMRWKLGRMLRAAAYDRIVLSIPPWPFHQFSGWLSRHGRLILDISDPLYKNAAIGMNTDSNGFKRFEGGSIRHAESVLYMSEPMAELYDEMGVASESLEFLTPSTDTTGYRRGERIVCKLNRPLEFIYGGLLYPGYRDLDVLARAVDGMSGLRFSVITPGEVPVSELIIREERMPQEELKRRYAAADVLLFVDNFFGHQVPSKIFELMAAGKPIFFVYDRRNEYLYKKLKGQQGIFFAENTVEDIRRVVDEICAKDEIEVCYTFDLEPYSDAGVTRRFMEILR